MFVDEIEVLLGNRNGDGRVLNEHKEIKIAEFLTAWDGFEQNKGAPVVVIGATNRKECLDAAILRRLPIKVCLIQDIIIFCKKIFTLKCNILMHKKQTRSRLVSNKVGL